MTPSHVADSPDGCACYDHLMNGLSDRTPAVSTPPPPRPFGARAYPKTR